MKLSLVLGLLVLIPVSCYAQTPSNITINATGQTIESWNTYKDPEGKFTIQYPSFISITPKQNRFDTNELSFSNENKSITGYITYTPQSKNDTSPQSLKLLVKGVNLVVGKFLDGFRVIDSNDTQIDGDYAISQITYKRISDGSEKGSWEVYSFKGSKIFKFTYDSPTDDFDKGLPTVQKMFMTLKFLK